jgi:hypothetical protein
MTKESNENIIKSDFGNAPLESYDSERLSETFAFEVADWAFGTVDGKDAWTDENGKVVPSPIFASNLETQLKYLRKFDFAILHVAGHPDSVNTIICHIYLTKDLTVKGEAGFVISRATACAAIRAARAKAFIDAKVTVKS